MKDASGAHLGRTPLELRYAPSTPPFDVTVERHGYARRTLHVAPDRDRDYVLELPALKPAHATPEAPPSKPPAPPTPAPTRPDGLKPVE